MNSTPLGASTLIVGLFFAAMVCYGEEAKSVSLFSILATPKEHDKSRVIVPGYLVSGHRNVLLYVDKESAAHGFSENAVPLNLISPRARAALKKRNNNYVRIIGRFAAYSRRSVVVSVGCLDAEYILLSSETLDFK